MNVFDVTYWNDAHKRRSMRSFSAFVAEFPRILKDGGYRCGVCHGSGRVIPDDAQPDPVEGYKHTTRVTCSSCNGTGMSTEKHWREWFKKEKAAWLMHEAERKQTEKIRKQALAKLTPNERKSLGV